MNTKTRTWIKHLALALCLAMPFVSRAAAVGDTITWTNAGDLTADDVVNANHCSFSLQLPATGSLPAGSVVCITNVQFASINSERVSNSSNNQNDPHSISIGNTRSSEVSFITSETLAGKYIDSYDFADGVEVEIGKSYRESWGAAYTQFSGCGITFLHSNGNRWSGGTTMNCTVGGTTSGVIANGGTVFPVYKITAKVVSIRQNVEVSTDTTANAINAMVGENATDVYVTVADGVTITIDTAFATEIKSVSSTGTITLSAETQPDLSGIAFNVQGALLRSWLAPGVVGVNFVKNYGNVVSGELVTSDSWVETTGANGNATTLFTDGLTKVTWSASGTYSYYAADDESVSFLHGYLDDGGNKGNGVEITIDGVPYETYDVVIYASTDTSSVKFRAKTVNDVAYTVAMSGAVSAGNADWGASRLETPLYGLNAMRIKNLSGRLSILGGTNSGNRGGIAAIQIMPTSAEDKPAAEYTLALNGADTKWSEGAWKIGESSVVAPLSGCARITLSASTTLTVDDTVALNYLVIDGSNDAVLTIVLDEGASLVSYSSVDIVGGVLKQGTASVLGSTPQLIVEDGGTFDMNGLGINASTKVYLAGAGAGNWPWALTSSSGAGGAILGGLYLNANATIGGANELKVGQTQAGYQCYLLGYTLTKTGAGAFTGTNMNTPGTGTIEVQGGAMSVNQWNNLNNNGGDTTVILNPGTSLINGTNRTVPMGTLKLLGGTLSTDSQAFKVNTVLIGYGETARLEFADGASASLIGDLIVTSALTLDGAMTFNKDENAVEDVVVTVSGTMSSSGTVSVGAGVTLNLGTNRPAGVFSVDDDGTLAVKKANASDLPVINVSSEPANAVLYDEEGVEVTGAKIVYDDTTGTLKFFSGNVWTANSGNSFDSGDNWSSSVAPRSGESATIQIAADTEISVTGTYDLSAITISGAGQVSFVGDGSISAANIYLQNGVTLTRNSKISATTGIAIDSGTVLKLNGVTESAAISGAGAVETYGTVVLNHANTMTGGITVKSGSLLSASAAGAYGEYNSDWAYSAQRQVVVEDGGTVDINNIANNDGGVALTIAGKGILVDGVYAGAVKYSGANAITSGSRQISSLVLTGDAMVDVGAGWGLVHSGWKNARLGLNGYTLTVRGTGTFPVVNANNLSGTATTGTLVMDGATLELSNAASNLTGVNIVAKGCSSINIATAPSALGSLAIRPSATGMTASGWNLPSTPVPSLDTSNVDPTGLTDGQELTLFTAPSALSSSTISVNAGGRFTTAIVDNTVVATFKAGMPANYVHYDFNGGTNKDTARAADSFAKIDIGGEAGGGGSNGRAAIVYNDGSTRYTPWWDTYTPVDLSATGKSPMHACEMTVTMAAKLNQTNMVLWGLGTTANSTNAVVGLVSLTATSVAVVTKSTAGVVDTVVTISNTSDLTKGYHFFAVVANASGTTLYVDNAWASSEKTLPKEIRQYGQLGSFHNGAQNVDAPGANLVGAAGFLVDDFRIYDAAMVHAEIRAIKREVSPGPLFIRLR